MQCSDFGLLVEEPIEVMMPLDSEQGDWWYNRAAKLLTKYVQQHVIQPIYAGNGLFLLFSKNRNKVKAYTDSLENPGIILSIVRDHKYVPYRVEFVIKNPNNKSTIRVPDLYLKVLEQLPDTKILLSDESLTPNGIRLWKNMVQRGYNIGVHKIDTPISSIVPITNPDDIDKYANSSAEAFDYQFVLSKKPFKQVVKESPQQIELNKRHRDWWNALKSDINGIVPPTVLYQKNDVTIVTWDNGHIIYAYMGNRRNPRCISEWRSQNAHNDVYQEELVAKNPREKEPHLAKRLYAAIRDMFPANVTLLSDKYMTAGGFGIWKDLVKDKQDIGLIDSETLAKPGIPIISSAKELRKAWGDSDAFQDKRYAYFKKDVITESPMVRSSTCALPLYRDMANDILENEDKITPVTPELNRVDVDDWTYFYLGSEDGKLIDIGVGGTIKESIFYVGSLAKNPGLIGKSPRGSDLYAMILTAYPSLTLMSDVTQYQSSLNVWKRLQKMGYTVSVIGFDHIAKTYVKIPSNDVFSPEFQRPFYMYAANKS